MLSKHLNLESIHGTQIMPYIDFLDVEFVILKLLKLSKERLVLCLKHILQIREHQSQITIDMCRRHVTMLILIKLACGQDASIK